MKYNMLNTSVLPITERRKHMFLPVAQGISATCLIDCLSFRKAIFGGMKLVAAAKERLARQGLLV